MDSSIQPTISAASIDGDSSKTVLSKHAKFLSTYRRNQPWSLPDSIIYYISKNPSNSKCYQKIIQSCKYFFIKNPLLVVSYLNIDYWKNQWNTSLNGKKVDLNLVSSKLWITDKLHIDNSSSTPQNSLSFVLSKIHHIDIKRLHIFAKDISINDLEFLASKCETIFFPGFVVKNDDGSTVALEKIVRMLPNIKEYSNFFVENASTIITSSTVKELIKVPHFPDLDRFVLYNIPETFDIDTFYGYLKKNMKTNIEISFGLPLSEAYKARLQIIVDEMISDPNRDYKLPIIDFPGINDSSRQTLYDLYYS